MSLEEQRRIIREELRRFHLMAVPERVKSGEALKVGSGDVYWATELTVDDGGVVRNEGVMTVNEIINKGVIINKGEIEVGGFEE